MALAPRLDHVVVNVLSDLDAAADRYRRLGFHLTPRGHHTLGTSNNLAIFGTDYLELLGYERGQPVTRADLVDSPAGLAGIAFKPPADPDFAAGISGAGPSRAFSRPVALDGGGSRDASFRTTPIAGALSSGRVFFCHHETPELVWRDEWRRHPNGASGIAAITIAAANPARTAAPFQALFGPAALGPIEGGLVLQADRTELRFLAPEAVSARYGDAGPAFEGLDRMVALDLRTASLDTTRAVLAAAGLPAAGAIPTVTAAEACGVVLSFVLT